MGDEPQDIGIKSAAEVVEDSITTFATHTRSHQLPSYIDGLKVVGRRILWVMKDVTKDTKGFRLIGNIMEYHPHGDGAITQSVNKMMQPFSNIKELVYCPTNYGTYYGEPPGAMRYLEIRRSDFAQDVYFNGINNRTLDYVMKEDGEGVEPKYLIPKIPMGLLTSVFGLSIGYKPNILPLNFNNLCDLTIAFIKHRTSVNGVGPTFRKHPEWFYPDSFIPNLLRNTPQIKERVMDHVYTGTTVYDGTLEVRNNMIILKTLPHGVNAGGVYKQFVNQMKKKNSFVANHIQQVIPAGKNMMHLELILKRNVNPFDILDNIKQMVKFTTTSHPNMLWSGPDGDLKQYGVVEVLENWYQTRKRSVLSDFKHTQNRYVEEYRQLEAKCIVIDHAQKVTEIVRKSPDYETSYKRLMEAFPALSYTQAKYLTTLRIAQLTGSGLKELQKAMKEIQEKLKELRKKFAQVDEIIIQSIKELQDKYNIPRQAYLPEFKGSIQTSKGVVQYWNNTELHNLTLNFKQENVHAVLYPNKTFYKYMFIKGNIVTEEERTFPKETPCDDWFISRRKLNQTICLTEGKIYRLSGMRYPKDDSIVSCPVGNYFTGISGDGQTHHVASTKIPLRKATVASGVITDIVYISHVYDENGIIVVHGNTQEVNKIRIDFIKPDEKLSKISVGNLILIGTYHQDDSFIINVPAECRNRNKVNYILVEDIKSVMGNKKSTTIFLNKTKPQNGLTVKKSSHGMYILDSN